MGQLINYRGGGITTNKVEFSCLYIFSSYIFLSDRSEERVLQKSIDIYIPLSREK